MIKNLIAAAMASILITQPPQNANDGTYYQDVNITESYEYETNEVNSVDDLVEGNIYHFEMNNIQLTTNVGFRMYYDSFYHLNFSATNLQNTTQSGSYLQLTNGGMFLFTISYPNVNSATNPGWRTAELDTITFSVDIVLNNIDIGTTNIIQYLSASDYLGEKTITVERVETEGLYNLAYHFLYSRIYTNTELQGMETTLFGTTINMNMWLAHTTAIVIICLLLIVLIKFVLWLFKIVSGGMLWQ